MSLLLILPGWAWGVDQVNVASALGNTKSILAGGGQADVTVIGDSLSFEGLGWSAWLPRFRTILQNRYGDAGRGYQEFHTTTGAHSLTGKTSGSGPNQNRSPYHALNGIWLGLDRDGSSAGMDAWGDQIELHYTVANPGGQLEIRNSGGAVLDTLNTQSSTLGAQAWPHTFTGGDRTLYFESLTTQGVDLLGLNNFNSSPGVRVHRGANSGYSTNSYLLRDATFDDQLALLDTDLVIVMLGQNDYYDFTTYQTVFGSLVDRLLSTVPDVLILGTYDSDRSGLQPQWDAQAAVAASKGVGFLNLGTTAGDYQFFMDNGYLYPDGIHHSAAGAEYLAEFIFDAFMTDGGSAVTPILRGDVDLTSAVNNLDIAPFIGLLTGGGYQLEADMDVNGLVNNLDIAPFIGALTGSGTSIPEPATAAVMMGLGVMVLRRRGNGA